MDHHTVAVVSLTGTCLDVLGSLYLAYDLLGGQHGPLRLLVCSRLGKLCNFRSEARMNRCRPALIVNHVGYLAVVPQSNRNHVV